jgi:hypothetical protein
MPNPVERDAIVIKWGVRRIGSRKRRESSHVRELGEVRDYGIHLG